MDNNDDINIYGATSFAGLRTFANLPFVDCFSDEHAESHKYDIAVFGASHDTTTTGRPGARFGPPAIRSGSQRKSPGEWSVYTGRNPLQDWATVVDCGDARLTWLDNTASLKLLDKAHTVISGRPAANSSVSTTPRILTLGGDHTTTLSALRSTYQRWGPVSVIHFDSHIDTWDPLVLGGGISDYAGLNHGTFLHIAHEEHLILNTSIHAGIRASLIRRKGDLRNDVRCGFEIITARDLDKLGAHGVISKLKERVGDSRVYISVDIDVLDPAFAPATGTAEPGGWSTRELLTILDGLEGLSVVGADVVEVAPAYDNNGETTVLAAAEIAYSLIDLMVLKPVQ
ncbi:Ureohydrolase [Colletotrichum phormii]|uniref:Ureohydrolase n=1 Tax=Colletotrichum phormii TaxID=359342 RepID=A0AAI9ZG91_9PEZI|nr:Ureohydrolase [Colletotrichum phormii]KAK1624023.1 Ureohydrolase [Colletotrichum phormii]